jgi:hypothetical protein
MDEFFLPAVQPIAVDLAQMASQQHMTLAKLDEIERVTLGTQTCDRCTATAVVLWESSPMCGECFFAVSIGRATGRDDLYLMIRTLDPVAANWVIRSILRRLAKPINQFQ